MEMDIEFTEAMDREFIDALASLGKRDVSAEGLTQDRDRVVIVFPDIDGIDEDPAVQVLRKHRYLLLVLVRRRDEGAATLGSSLVEGEGHSEFD